MEGPLKNGDDIFAKPDRVGETRGPIKETGDVYTAPPQEIDCTLSVDVAC